MPALIRLMEATGPSPQPQLYAVSFKILRLSRLSGLARRVSRAETGECGERGSRQTSHTEVYTDYSALEIEACAVEKLNISKKVQTA